MSRRVSLNARLALDAEATTEIEVVLFHITHPELDAPIRLCTDNTLRLSVDPLMYGTRSSWMTADPISDPFLFILADALLPSEDEDAPAEAQLIVQVLDASYAELLRSFTTPATVDMAVVMAETPDVVEQQWLGLQLTTANIEDDTITIDLSREEIELEYFPPGRMIRLHFPGLHL
ncbi:hypothetical protein [Celeribacter baekdonensis]|uniref:hypothetical protein n=1 Tax=Celeribacter baekdonensis TaxID=875171 RepID=UPI0030D9FD47|tara:strand:- start:6493 stop:7020 length:528 start_codon:yes stop_codon:yes gene_type:complete